MFFQKIAETVSVQINPIQIVLCETVRKTVLINNCFNTTVGRELSFVQLTKRTKQ